MKKRNAYLDNFQKTASGEYIYSGNILEFNGDENAFKSFKLKMCVLTIVGFILSLLSGILPVPGAINTWYIILPYALEIIMMGMGIYKELRLFRNGIKVREYIYDKTFKEFKSIFYVAIVGSTLSLIGEIVYWILNSFTFLVYVYILCKIICIIISYINISITKRNIYTVIN